MLCGALLQLQQGLLLSPCAIQNILKTVSLKHLGVTFNLTSGLSMTD